MDDFTRKMMDDLIEHFYVLDGSKLRNTVTKMDVEHGQFDFVDLSTSTPLTDRLDKGVKNLAIAARECSNRFGKRTDDMIVKTLCHGDGFTGKPWDKHIERAINRLPADRFALVGWRQWSELLRVDDFSKAPYLTQAELPWPFGGVAKRWNDTVWMPHTGLPHEKGHRYCFVYPRSAVEHFRIGGFESEIAGEHIVHLAVMATRFVGPAVKFLVKERLYG